MKKYRPLILTLSVLALIFVAIGIAIGIAIGVTIHNGSSTMETEQTTPIVENESSQTESTPEPPLLVSSDTASEMDLDDKPLLVNRQNEIPDDYSVDLITLSNGEQVAEEIMQPLQDMFDEMRAEGLSPYVNSGYRSVAYQQGLLEQEISLQEAKGFVGDEARKEAEKWVALPGTSEHHTGLAVDISMDNNYDVWEWLEENAYRYGFHLRYTEEKQSMTGIYPEPWHYRYVGKEIAKELYDKNLCLEEYVGQSGGTLRKTAKEVFLMGTDRIPITPRDRLLRGWENSMELVRDFETYSKEIHNDPEAAELFAELAEEEGVHAAKLQKAILQRQERSRSVEN